MSITIRGTTSIAEIQKLTKAELVKIIREHPRRLKFGDKAFKIKGALKTELLDAVVRIRDLISEKERKQAEELAEERREIIDRETNDSKIGMALESLHQGLQNKRESLKKVCEEFATRISESPLHPLEPLRWRAEEAIHAQHYLQMLDLTAGMIRDQILERTKTIQEIMLHLERTRDLHIRECLTGASYLQGSSSPMDRISSIQKFRAQQSMSALMQSSRDALELDIENKEHSRYGWYISDVPSR
jgi:hypothetical protein